jgi:hypothetical protein
MLVPALILWLLFSIIVLISLKDKKVSDILGWIGVGVLAVVVLNFLIP